MLSARKRVFYHDCVPRTGDRRHFGAGYCLVHETAISLCLENVVFGHQNERRAVDTVEFTRNIERKEGVAQSCEAFKVLPVRRTPPNTG